MQNFKWLENIINNFINMAEMRGLSVLAKNHEGIKILEVEVCEINPKKSIPSFYAFTEKDLRKIHNILSETKLKEATGYCQKIRAMLET